MRIALFSLIALLWAASPAAAATVVGQTHDPTECSDSGYSVLQTAVASGDGYTVPAGGGVITSWSVQAGYDATAVVALRVYRPADAGWELRSESSPQPLERYVLNTFPARVSVSAGDLVAMQVVAGIGPPCVFESLDPLDTWDEIYPDDGVVGDVQAPAFSGDGYRLNLSAVVEPDADGDGYGDETQDLCATDVALHDSACPAPPAADPPPPPSPETDAPADDPPPSPATPDPQPQMPDPVPEPPATPGPPPQSLPQPTSARAHLRGRPSLTRAGNVVVTLSCQANACEVHLTVRFRPHVAIVLRRQVRVRSGRTKLRVMLTRAQRHKLRGRHRHVRVAVSVR